MPPEITKKQPKATEIIRSEEDLLPREVVEYLDKFIVGQHEAKRAVAKALRDRWRRKHLSLELRDEVYPKNILMIGPTGVGKTEIARRLSRLTKSPFLKVEASKYTEVGYVGRDVESMIRDLVEAAVNMSKEEEGSRVKAKARRNADERILDSLIPRTSRRTANMNAENNEPPYEETRAGVRARLRKGELDEQFITISLAPKPMPAFEIVAGGSIDEINMNLKDMMSSMFQGGKREKTMTIAEAREFLMREEEQRLIDMERVTQEAIARAESMGIIFLDEIDKIAGRESGGHGPQVSREGVQRDLLPVVEGTAVFTKYGTVRTDHILFIASGAFHVNKPSDLIPELQGRFPIRVELNSLTKEDFIRILTEPQNSLVRQYTEMMAVEGVKITFKEDAVASIAEIAFKINERTENIGARRLYTVMEKLFDDISFRGPELSGKTVTIDAKYVHSALESVLKDEDLSRYIL